ncbi:MULTISPECIES: hypothetical protein [unclassified Spirillospora]|uniref:hypothetical protein n=1 Tax=unclassified Spirillospora TaxID=2642701 RepID=UPI00371C8117
MDYGSVLLALAGGVIGSGSALLVDMQRRRHERRERFLDRRRDAYELFLAALIDTDAGMRALAQAEGTPVTRDRVRNAFDANSLLALRYRVHLIAPEPVVSASDEVYYRLRYVREALVETNLPVGVRESQEWQDVHKPYRDALQNLISVMQHDIIG